MKIAIYVSDDISVVAKTCFYILSGIHSIQVGGAIELFIKISLSEAAADTGFRLCRWLAVTETQLDGSVYPNRDLWLERVNRTCWIRVTTHALSNRGQSGVTP